jgi:large subunit ribosomal protein L31
MAARSRDGLRLVLSARRAARGGPGSPGATIIAVVLALRQEADYKTPLHERLRVMPKKGIHPTYKPATISCACGHKVETYSTRGSFMVDICSNCHPFYTGKQKFLDTGGRIERFNKKYGRPPTNTPTT